MVKFRYPTQLVDIPERLYRVEVRYEVIFTSGEGRNFVRLVNSVFNLPALLRSRLSSSDDVQSVKVFLPSGRMALMCYRCKSSK